MIDTHIHLDDPQYDSDRDDVIRRFFEAGGEALINIGAGMGTSRASVELAGRYEKIYAAVGLHPHYFMKHETFGSRYRREIKDLAGEEKVVAIGEIGLDYFFRREDASEERKNEYKRRQKEGFLFQLDLAGELGLPAIIHCRDAYEDVYEIVKSFYLSGKIKTVMHCYGGNVEMTEKFLELDLLFSFTGNITYAKPGAEIFEVIKMIPLERIMLETDGPYLTPATQRGKRNEPAYLREVAERIALIKREEEGRVILQTSKNSRNFFGI